MKEQKTLDKVLYNDYYVHIQNKNHYRRTCDVEKGELMTEELKKLIKTVEKLDGTGILLIQNAANVLLTQQTMEQQKKAAAEV